jgi:uncharacterized membrane protein YccC
MSVTVILVVGTHLNTEGAVERFGGVVLGGLCALAASALATPTKDTRLLRADLEALQDSLSDLLAQIAKGLREPTDRATAKEWREEAVALRNRSIGLAARLQDPDDLALLKQSLDATNVMSSRVLSIASDLTGATARASTPLPPAAMSPLADLMAMAADNISAEDPATSIGRTQAHEAVRVADQTAQIALIGGIVSNLNRINQASNAGHDPDDDTGDIPT